jgi:hypothetical protein
MSDQPEKLIVVYLRRIDTKVDDLRQGMIEVKERLGLIETQYASLSRRVDRMGGDIERINKRLDLTETHA